MHILIAYNNNLIIIMHSSTCIEAVGQAKKTFLHSTIDLQAYHFALWNQSSNIHSYYIKAAP